MKLTEIFRRSFGCWARVCLVVFITLPSLSTLNGANVNHAKQWLDRMARAMETLDYQGTLVFLHEGELDVMKLVHAVTVDGERERLFALNGEPTEVLRTSEEVIFVTQSNKSVLVDERIKRPLFPNIPRERLSDLQKSYQLQVLGTDRVVGLNATVIGITAKDSFRYGYRFWLEERSGLLLKSELINAKGDVIEMLMFTSLTIGEISLADLEPEIKRDGFITYTSEAGETEDIEKIKQSWAVMRRPDGFSLNAYKRDNLSAGNGLIDQLVYSDGLASVSVYVEKLQNKEKPPIGHSMAGAMHAFGVVLENHLITVVGEVPQATVESIGRSVVRQ